MICPRCTAHTVPLDDGRPFCPACLWEGEAPGRPRGRPAEERNGAPPVAERVQAWIERTIERRE